MLGEIHDIVHEFPNFRNQISELKDRNPVFAATSTRWRSAMAIDARRGMVAIEGWTRTTSKQAIDLAKQFEDSGVAAINYTDTFIL